MTLDYNIATINVPGPLAAGGTLSVSAPWTPGISGIPPGVVHACLKAQGVTPFDTDYSNNGAQHNVNIQQTHSPAAFHMRVVNPTGTNITVTLSNNLPVNWSIHRGCLRLPASPTGPVTFQMAAKDCPRTLDIFLTPPLNLTATQAVSFRIFGTPTNSNQQVPLGGMQIVAVVPVSNAPPAVASDSYNYFPNNPLKNVAPGVLCNDSDPNGDHISAVLISAAQNGQVRRVP